MADSHRKGLDVMKKKQMLAMLVMLSLLQTTAYADYLKPALTQEDKFDGLVWWHDGELYAKNEDGVVQKLEIVTDTDGHRVATANIKGDVTGTALDYSFGLQSNRPTDELVLEFGGNVDVGYTNQNNWEGISGNGFMVGTDTFDMTIKMQDDKTLYVGTPIGHADAAFALLDYGNESKTDSVDLNIIGGNIVTHYDGGYDDESLAVFGAWENLNGGIKPGVITVNNQSITSTLADDFEADDTIISGTELNYGHLNINTNNFKLGTEEVRFDRGAWISYESSAKYNTNNELSWYVEDYGALVQEASNIEFSGAGNALLDVANGSDGGGIWLTGGSKANTGENGINSLTISGAQYGMIAQTGSSFNMAGNNLTVKNVGQGIYLDNSKAEYNFGNIEFDNNSYVARIINGSELTITADDLTAASNKYGFYASDSTITLTGGNFTANNADRNIWLENASTGTADVNKLNLNNAKYGILLQTNSNLSVKANALDIQNGGITSATGFYLSGKSTTDVEAAQSTVNSVFAVYAKEESQYSLKTDYGDITGQIKMIDGSVATFSGLEAEEYGSITIKNEKNDAVTAVSDVEKASEILFKQAAFINSQGDKEYHADKHGKRTKSAIRANRNSVITLDKAAGIYGDIIAGRGNESNATGGKITINSVEGAEFKGDVLAGNSGEITLTLNGASYEGRVDDYADASLSNDPNEEDVVFRPGEFDVDVTSGGKVNMTLNNKSTWQAHGQNFVTVLTFGENGGTVNLVNDSTTRAAEQGNSITIRNLEGDGVFNMSLNSKNYELGDMLYIGKNEGNQTINIVGGITGGLENISKDNPLRFATVGIDTVSDNPAVNNSGIKAYTRDAGFADIEYYVDKEKYDTTDDDNVKYNGAGDGKGVDKPGNNFVEGQLVANRENAVNWIITGAKEIGNGGSQVSDAGKTIINMSKVNYNNAIYMDRLNKRLGEARYINPEDEQGMWVRIRHDRIGKDDAFRSQNTMYEMGYDEKQECDNGERRVGFAIDYMDGKAEYTGIAGSGDVKRYGLWLYDTWMGDKGHYADYVAKWGHLENDFDIMARSTGEKINGDYSNNVFSVSAEYGRKKDIGNDWYVEPQAQLQLARVTGADYTTSQGTRVSLDGINSLIGRAGFRLGRDVDERSTVYVKADLLHEFLGEQDMHVVDNTFNGSQSFENKGTWYDVGFGFATALGKDSYAFMDFEKSFGNDNDETYQINVGMQWSF